MSYEIHALPPEILEQARSSADGPAHARSVATGGEPLRCCLRDARAGEELLLFTYEPPLPPSPYREVGAVFAHAVPCAGPQRAADAEPDRTANAGPEQAADAESDRTADSGPDRTADSEPDRTAGGGYPDAWRGRPQVLRAYDARGWIHPSTRVHDGSDPDGALAAVFADPDVVQVHSRNVAYGCFMFVATRSSR
ncbi:hypothetical protein BJY16_007672 [Actinoplanes octamycinicus]|uniref:DUF1203 domain-containing protein n=1 Tax=Actinoplanes octamycinicus TaxID=135948 RepID=A0A7W7MBL0_9ACTN|nr:DUF1203 domain-containing protein [Actinoplanes octamycinicus]MBB4744213.1 hypothetical protein [Actinoplanes octamycinicus]GIE56828.1 hypothetical protein Aoc01nite_22300 [Actinoplanes octamycinicus]